MYINCINLNYVGKLKWKKINFEFDNKENKEYLNILKKIRTDFKEKYDEKNLNQHNFYCIVFEFENSENYKYFGRSTSTKNRILRHISEIISMSKNDFIKLNEKLKKILIDDAWDPKNSLYIKISWLIRKYKLKNIKFNTFDNKEIYEKNKKKVNTLKTQHWINYSKLENNRQLDILEYYEISELKKKSIIYLLNGTINYMFKIIYAKDKAEADLYILLDNLQEKDNASIFNSLKLTNQIVEHCFWYYFNKLKWFKPFKSFCRNEIKQYLKDKYQNKTEWEKRYKKTKIVHLNKCNMCINKFHSDMPNYLNYKRRLRDKNKHLAQCKICLSKYHKD